MSNPKFTIHRDVLGEYVLRLHHPSGSYAGFGMFNSLDEANLVLYGLKSAIRDDPVFHDRCIDYFEMSGQRRKRKGGATT